MTRMFLFCFFLQFQGMNLLLDPLFLRMFKPFVKTLSATLNSNSLKLFHRRLNHAHQTSDE